MIRPDGTCPHEMMTRRDCPLCRRIDAAAGEKLRAEGEAKALEAQPVWLEQAEAAMRQLAGTGRPFTAEDLVDIVGLPGVGTHRSNAVGALFSRWAKSHQIKEVGTTRTKRKSSHNSTIRVWVGFRNEEALGYKQRTLL